MDDIFQPKRSFTEPTTGKTQKTVSYHPLRQKINGPISSFFRPRHQDTGNLPGKYSDTARLAMKNSTINSLSPISHFKENLSPNIIEIKKPRAKKAGFSGFNPS